MQKIAYNNNEVIKLSKTFPVIYEIDEDGYFVATCPVFEGCYSQGETVEEAKVNIKEAIELCLEELNDNEPPNHTFLLSQVDIS